MARLIFENKVIFNYIISVSEALGLTVANALIKRKGGGIIMEDKSALVAIILGALISIWTVSKTWGKRKNK